MKQLASRLRRLDDALADLPLEEPMLLTELDGFLTGISVSPEAILPAEWLQSVWGSDDSGVAAFDDPLDVQWFADAVMARHAEIARDLARGKLRPIFDVDERNGDVLWELWIDGFAEAMALRPDGWDAVANGDDPDAAAPLDSVEINALEDRATTDLVDGVQRLHTARSRRQTEAPAQTIGAASAKIGRNDPCPCGSGKKSKRCCG